MNNRLSELLGTSPVYVESEIEYLGEYSLFTLCTTKNLMH